MDYKKRLLFDFDGVIHSYTSGWKGVEVAKDKPVKGMKEAIDNLKSSGKYSIVIYSARCICKEGIKCIEEYCKKYDIYYDEISPNKSYAYLTIDDRCITFNGDSDILCDLIDNFKSYLDEKFI